MNIRSKFTLMIAAAALVVPQAATAGGPNPKLWNGTWTLDAAKSKFNSPAKEASETRRYTIGGGKVMMKSTSTDSSGKELSFSYTAGLDGKRYPMVGNPNADSISLTAVSAQVIKAHSRLHGKLTVQSTATVSADGKHLTLQRQMLRFKGAPTDVLVFKR